MTTDPRPTREPDLASLGEAAAMPEQPLGRVDCPTCGALPMSDAYYRRVAGRAVWLMEHRHDLRDRAIQSAFAQTEPDEPDEDFEAVIPAEHDHVAAIIKAGIL